MVYTICGTGGVKHEGMHLKHSFYAKLSIDMICGFWYNILIERNLRSLIVEIKYNQ